MSSRTIAPLDEAVAEVLREEMYQQHVTAVAMADQLDMHINTYYGYYHGRRRMSISDLVAICDVLGVPVQQVVDGARKLVSVEPAPYSPR